MEYIRLHIRFPPDLHRRLKVVAAMNRITMTSMIINVLGEFVSKEEQKKRRTSDVC